MAIGEAAAHNMQGLPRDELPEPDGDASPSPDLPAELIRDYVAGDRAAFRRLFEVIGPQLGYLVSRYFRSPFDQEEAFQEVWLQLYRVRRSFDVSRYRAFGGWARQVARNRCLDLIKARARSREVPVAAPEAEPGDDAPESDQVRALLDGRVREALDVFVAGLDEEQRRYFGCCFVEELPHEEIALRLHISVRRSKYLKKKLLARLVDCAPLREMGRS